jgi:hypothetical protein
MEVAALATRNAGDGSKTVLDTDAVSPDTAWVGTPPQAPGIRAMLSVTDTASAARFGLQTARLSRAGDDATGREFVAPDTAGLLAGHRAMQPSGVEGVSQGTPDTTTAGAYPLTMLTYAAVAPRPIDQPARDDYASFIDFSTTDGQTTGLEVGQLPPGYAPLPDDLRLQAHTAADLIRSGLPVPPEPEAAPTEIAAPAVTTRPVPAAATPAASVQSPARVLQARRTTPVSLPAAVTPVKPLPAPKPARAKPKRPLVRTPGEGTGLLRFAVPLAGGIGLLGLLAVLMMDDRWQRALVRNRSAPGSA